MIQLRAGGAFRGSRIPVQMIEFVKTVPVLILAGSGFLVVLATWLYLLMRREAGRLRAQFAALRTAWAAVEPLGREERPAGLDGRKVSEVHSKCKDLDGPAR